MSGELFNETDNKFYIFYFGQQGLWAQGPWARDLEKWSKNGNLWVKNVKIFFAQYADDAHRCALMRIGRCICMALPSFRPYKPYIF